MACHGQPAHGLGLAHDNRALWVTGTKQNKSKKKENHTTRTHTPSNTVSHPIAIPQPKQMLRCEITVVCWLELATLGSFQNALIFRLLLRITVERITTSDFPSFWRGATLVPSKPKANSPTRHRPHTGARPTRARRRRPADNRQLTATLQYSLLRVHSVPYEALLMDAVC